MPLMILGLFFLIGLFLYYLLSTSSKDYGNSDSGKTNPPPKEEENIKQHENVIFLPNDIEIVKKKHRNKNK